MQSNNQVFAPRRRCPPVGPKHGQACVLCPSSEESESRWRRESWGFRGWTQGPGDYVVRHALLKDPNAFFAFICDCRLVNPVAGKDKQHSRQTQRSVKPRAGTYGAISPNFRTLLALSLRVTVAKPAFGLPPLLHLKQYLSQAWLCGLKIIEGDKA